MAVLTATCIMVGLVINGTIDFSYDSATKNTKITGTLLAQAQAFDQTPLSQHGFHVHTSGNLSDASGTCKLTGGHYNPHNKTHGAPTDTERHAGDLGNVKLTQNGEIVLNITDTLIPLDGAFSVVGRAVVIHAGVDDLGKGGDAGSKSTGNAGSRVNCCQITDTTPPTTIAPTTTPATIAPTTKDSAGYTLMVSKATVLASILLAITWTVKFMY